ncbi:MAG: hypothetical protein LAQ69_29665 [Acidobacteriia bacterium]|nr:hypothetical protein [Terriglobia bacterium]
MSEHGPTEHWQDVEELWRDRLSEAKARYEIAVARFRTAAEDVRTRHTPGPDGSFSVHLAIAEESSARKEYMRVLRVFTDLLLNGRIPDEKAPDGNPAMGSRSLGRPRKAG